MTDYDERELGRLRIGKMAQETLFHSREEEGNAERSRKVYLLLWIANHNTLAIGWLILHASDGSPFTSLLSFW